jgi:hypothetical protein
VPRRDAPRTALPPPTQEEADGGDLDVPTDTATAAVPTDALLSLPSPPPEEAGWSRSPAKPPRPTLDAETWVTTATPRRTAPSRATSFPDGPCQSSAPSAAEAAVAAVPVLMNRSVAAASSPAAKRIPTESPLSAAIFFFDSAYFALTSVRLRLASSSTSRGHRAATENTRLHGLKRKALPPIVPSTLPVSPNRAVLRKDLTFSVHQFLIYGLYLREDRALLIFIQWYIGSRCLPDGGVRASGGAAGAEVLRAPGPAGDRQHRRRRRVGGFEAETDLGWLHAADVILRFLLSCLQRLMVSRYVMIETWQEWRPNKIFYGSYNLVLVCSCSHQ